MSMLEKMKELKKFYEILDLYYQLYIIFFFFSLNKQVKKQIKKLK